MSIDERNASSVSGVLDAVKEIRNSWNPSRNAPEEIWFRGQARQSDELVPSLYRDDVVKMGYDEATIMTAFADLGTSYVTQRPSNDWEWYFLARHHGLPSRLLDWSENALAAVYFALEEAWRATRKTEIAAGSSGTAAAALGDESPVVWIVDAGTVNKFSQGVDALFSPASEQIAAYLPDNLNDPVKDGYRPPESPVALHPPRQTPRIIAQQGMFTLHGRDARSLDALARSDEGEEVIRLGKIVLDRSALASFIDDLTVFGMGRLALFPDLDSVAEHVKWHYSE